MSGLTLQDAMRSLFIPVVADPSSDPARLPMVTGRAWRRESGPLLEQLYACAMITRQGGSSCGLGAAAGGVGRSRVLMQPCPQEAASL